MALNATQKQNVLDDLKAGIIQRWLGDSDTLSSLLPKKGVNSGSDKKQEVYDALLNTITLPKIIFYEKINSQECDSQPVIDWFKQIKNIDVLTNSIDFARACIQRLLFKQNSESGELEERQYPTITVTADGSGEFGCIEGDSLLNKTCKDNVLKTIITSYFTKDVCDKLVEKDELLPLSLATNIKKITGESGTPKTIKSIDDVPVEYQREQGVWKALICEMEDSEDKPIGKQLGTMFTRMEELDDAAKNNNNLPQLKKDKVFVCDLLMDCIYNNKNIGNDKTKVLEAIRDKVFGLLPDDYAEEVKILSTIRSLEEQGNTGDLRIMAIDAINRCRAAEEDTVKIAANFKVAATELYDARLGAGAAYAALSGKPADDKPSDIMDELLY